MRRPAVALFAASCTALFVELLLIRWEASEIPVLAYFKNFPLLSVFIGLGLGCLLAGRRPAGWPAGLWALTALVVAVAGAEPLGLTTLIFPDDRLDVWNRVFDPHGRDAVWTTARNLGAIFAVLVLNATAFVGLGQAVGAWLKAGPPLAMYTVDLLGSLAGVLGFALASWLQTPPAVWLLAGAAGLGLVGAGLGRWRASAIPLAIIVAVATLRAGRSSDPAALVRWSPYYRIEVTKAFWSPPPESAPLVFKLDVNRDYHQAIADFSDAHEKYFHMVPTAWRYWQLWRTQYGFAGLLKPRPRSVLIGGAGTGNNVAAALRSGAAKVTAVEIDPAILELGERLHPMRPYQSPAVVRVNNDVRSFVRRSRETFDLIEFGILDSHTALSALSSLRLENYVYTVEGIREAAARLAPDGIMVLSFHDGGRPWLGRRLYANILAATGQAPIGTQIEQMAFFAFGPGLDPAKAAAVIRAAGLPRMEIFYASGGVASSTDDWPFLYTNPAGQPTVYYLSLLLIVAVGILAVWTALPAGAGGAPPRLDPQMFFLGAGFLLIETKAIAELSLLFGSTWTVNTFVFVGIFVMVLLANGATALGAGRWRGAAHALLFAALAAWYVLPRAALNDLDFPVRALVGTGLVVLPVFFAGIVFSGAFATRADPSRAFGFNLIGAMVGGALEAVSLVSGLRALTLLVALLYALAWTSADSHQPTSPPVAVK